MPPSNTYQFRMFYKCYAYYMPAVTICQPLFSFKLNKSRINFRFREILLL